MISIEDVEKVEKSSPEAHNKDLVRNAWTILYVAEVLRYQQVTMQQKMKAIDAAGRAKVCILRL